MCDTIKDYNYGVIKANERYEKLSETILSMLDKLENNEEIDLKKLNKYIKEVEQLGRVYPSFNPEDITQIRSIINKIENKSNNIKE